MLLFIDTSDYSGVRFALVPSPGSGRPIKKFLRELSYNENFKTLELLQKFIKNNRLTPAAIEKIIVCSGPGSFTGIRVGIALAQAMGFALNIPVAAIPKEKIPDSLAKLWKLKSNKKLILNYGREPNITTTKKTVKK
jgi:tRNA A37 threonylcarbamoyladenosine modification protein TsaB